jgi:hypothetical protein
MKLFILSLLATTGLIIGATASKASAYQFCDFRWEKNGKVCYTTAGSECAGTGCYENPYLHTTFSVAVVQGVTSCICECCVPH